MPLYKKKDTIITTGEIIRAEDINVNASSTVEIISINNDLGRTIKWIISVIDDINDHYGSLEILSTRKDLDIDYVNYALSGDNINFTAEITTDGTNTKLEIINNELSALVVSVASIIP